MNLLTTNFKVDFTDRYIDKVEENIAYVFGGKSIPYDNDEIIEPIKNSIHETYYRVYDEMIFAKKLNLTNVAPAIRYIPWVAGTVYTQYDDKVLNLDKLNFYVITQQGDNYSVFKCICNAKGSPSTVPPLLSQTSPTDEMYKTIDNYIWKLMYTIDRGQFLRFSTNKFFPIFRNQDVEDNAVNGAIDKIIIEDQGQGYIPHTNGVISQINIGGNSRKIYIQSVNGVLSGIDNFYNECAFYITSGPAAGQQRKIIDYGFEGNNRFIVIDLPFFPNVTTSSTFEISPNVILNGDGEGFQGRTIINPESDRIENIEVVRRGSGYTNASVSFGVNSEILDLDVFSPASARAIIPPPGGHGFNSRIELFATYITNSITLFDNEVPVDNDFRQIGIIQNPIITKVIYVLDSISNISVNNIITQGNTTARITSVDLLTFEVHATDVKGHIDPNLPIIINDSEYNITSVIRGTEIIDTRTELTVDINFGPGFLVDEIITQENTGARAIVHGIDGSKLFVTNIIGKFGITTISNIIGQQSGTKAVINNITEQGIRQGSGDIIFIENISPITRNENESEQIKIVLGF